MPEFAQPYSLPMQFASIPAESPVRAEASGVKPFEGVDVIGETSRAYKLADQMKTHEKGQEERADQTMIQEALKQGADIQTPEGVLDLAKTLKGKVTPGTYENLVAMHGKLKQESVIAESNLRKMDSAKLDQLTKQGEFVVQNMDSIMSEYESDVEKVGVPAALDNFEKKKQATVQSMVQMQALNASQAEQLAKMSPGELNAKITASKYYADKVKSAAELKRIEAQTKMYEGKAEAATAGPEELAMLAQAEEKYGKESAEYKAILNKVSGRGAAGGAAQTPSLTPEAIDMLARRVLKGDAKALQNLGRGAQGAADVAAVQNRVAEVGRAEKVDASKILQAQAEIGAVNTGLRQLAGRQSKIDAAAIEVDKFAENALASSKKVARGDIVPVNAIMQKVKMGTGSPEEAEFATYVQSLVGAYATVIGRGSPTVHAQEEAAKIIRRDYSPAQFEAMVNALKQETVGVIQSSEEAAKHIKKGAFPAEKEMRAAAQGDMGADPKALEREIAQTKADLAKVTDAGSKQQLTDHLASLEKQRGGAPSDGMTVSVNGKVFKRPPGMSDEMWVAYKKAKGL